MKKTLLFALSALCIAGCCEKQTQPTQTAVPKIESTGELPILAWHSIPADSTTLERFLEMKNIGINTHFSGISRCRRDGAGIGFGRASRHQGDHLLPRIERGARKDGNAFYESSGIGRLLPAGRTEYGSLSGTGRLGKTYPCNR